MEGKKRPQKEVDLSRWIGGGSNKQGNSHARLVLGIAR